MYSGSRKNVSLCIDKFDQVNTGMIGKLMTRTKCGVNVCVRWWWW